MHIVRVGRRFLNLALMRHAHIAPSGDTLYIYWHNHALSDTEAAGYDCEAFHGQEAWRLIDYLTENARALVWSEGNATDAPKR